jgi:hypothetical protein
VCGGGTESKTGWVNTTLNGASIGNVTLGGTGDTNPIYSGGTNAYSSGNGVWWVSYNVTDSVTEIVGKVLKIKHPKLLM